MTNQNKHWTQDDPKDFVAHIAFDFIAQLEQYLEAEKMTRGEFAEKLQVDKSRVSQLMNGPGNLELLTAVQMVLVLGRKVALVAYDDGDRKNMRGPVNSVIFEQCWNARNGPRVSKKAKKKKE